MIYPYKLKIKLSCYGDTAPGASTTSRYYYYFNKNQTHSYYAFPSNEEYAINVKHAPQ